MNWRDVFDSGKRWYGHQSQAQLAAKEAGYKFYCWNGRIYAVDFTENFGDTGLTVEDVQ